MPELECIRFEESVNFYTNILGFEVLFERQESKFCFIALSKAQIMLKQANGYWQTGHLDRPLGRGINLQIIIDDCAPLLGRLKTAAIPLFDKPQDNWYRTGDIERGQREFLVQDLDGYLLRFGQSLGTRPITDH